MHYSEFEKAEFYRREAITRHKRGTRIKLAILYGASVIVALIGVLTLTGCQLVTPQIVTTRVIKTADGFTIESPKDIKATFHQSPDGTISATYESRANETAVKAGAEESAARASAVARLAEAAAALK